MYELLKKNQKKLLAVLGAFLMVSFLVTGTMAPSGGSRSRGIPIGKIGKTPLYADERRQSKAEWDALRSSYSISLTVANMQRMGQRQRISPLARLGNAIASGMNDHPELFLLLVKEAEARGIAISDDILNTVLKNEIQTPGVTTPDDSYKLAVRHFLMVQALHDQIVANSARFSEPMWKHDVAEYGQEISLNLVEFTTDQLKFSTTAPTTRQVEALFEQYRHVQAPDSSNSSAPPTTSLSFGYEVPNRAKLQYLQIPAAQILESVKAEKDAYEREVEARMYYLRNQSQFVRLGPPTTAPATQPTTSASPSTQSSTQSAATTQPTPATQASNVPTTRPFAEVKDEILNIILAPDVAQKQKQVADAIHQRLMDDYQAYRRQHPDTSSTTAPAIAATSPATQPLAYDTYAYLEAVALDIQKQFNVLPKVHQIAEWEDASQLAKEPGLGSATISKPETAKFQPESTPFFASNPGIWTGGIQLWQPSDLLNDPDKNVYIFRLTEESPAHSPDLAEVRTRVEADASTQAAYESANAAAAKFIEAAKRDSFSHAALDDHRVILSTGVFKPRGFVESFPNFKSSPEATSALVAKARDLLNEATANNLHPMAIVPMPGERKVIVAQLGDLYLATPESDLYAAKLQTARSEEMFANETLADAYFTFNAVSARLDYHEDPALKNSGS